MGDTRGTATFGARLQLRDARRFVGRMRELAILNAVFAEDPVGAVVHIHGPGGIGKSALLREAARRAAERGWTPVWVEGRELPPIPEALEDAVAPARALDRPLLILDTYERMAALDTYVRSRLVPSLPEQAVVLVAGRRGPSAAWFQGGWEHVTLELPLNGLGAVDSLELLRRHGISDQDRMLRISDAAAGSPLALTLMADAARVEPEWGPASGELREVLRPLARQLLEDELDPARYDVLAVAAIARVVTPDLLRDVLPAEDEHAAYAWLAARSFSERLGDGLALHDLVRRAVRAELRANDAERERELRRRIADSLHARAQAGDLLLTIDLAELAESRVVASGYGWHGSQRFHLDAASERDAQEVSEALRAAGHASWWDDAARFFERAPELVSIARALDGTVAGYSISLTPASAPAFAKSDPVLGPWLEHAGSLGDGAVLWRETWDFTRDPRSGVVPMVAMAGILRSGLRNPRYAYLPIHAGHPGHLAFSRALGGCAIPELRVSLHGLDIECHLVDYGPGGLLGAQRDLVYREIGLTPPGEREDDEGDDRPEIDADAVRAALRSFHHPHRLAESPLATGRTPAERAQSVQSLLLDAIEQCFGDTPDEVLLRRAVEAGYVERGSSLEAAADALHLSRSAYFRRLRSAAERIARHILSTPR